MDFLITRCILVTLVVRKWGLCGNCKDGCPKKSGKRAVTRYTPEIAWGSSVRARVHKLAYTHAHANAQVHGCVQFFIDFCKGGCANPWSIRIARAHAYMRGQPSPVCSTTHTYTRTSTPAVQSADRPRACTRKRLIVPLLLTLPPPVEKISEF